jgi:hypothetical protein
VNTASNISLCVCVCVGGGGAGDLSGRVSRGQRERHAAGHAAYEPCE